MSVWAAAESKGFVPPFHGVFYFAIMSLEMTVINVGFISGFFSIWPKLFIIDFAFATPAAFVAPLDSEYLQEKVMGDPTDWNKQIIEDFRANGGTEGTY